MIRQCLLTLSLTCLALALSACAGSVPVVPNAGVQAGITAVQVGRDLYCTFATPQGRATIRKKLTGTERAIIDVCAGIAPPNALPATSAASLTMEPKAATAPAEDPPT